MSVQWGEKTSRGEHSQYQIEMEKLKTTVLDAASFLSVSWPFRFAVVLIYPFIFLKVLSTFFELLRSLKLDEWDRAFWNEVESSQRPICRKRPGQR